MLIRSQGQEPLDPPYPSPWSIGGPLVVVVHLLWFAGLVLVIRRQPVGWALVVPGFVRLGCVFSGVHRLRLRALDRLKLRASAMTEIERAQEIEKIIALYGGKAGRATQQRIAEIRAMPQGGERPRWSSKSSTTAQTMSRLI